jgi:hypothetical protein
MEAGEERRPYMRTVFMILAFALVVGVIVKVLRDRDALPEQLEVFGASVKDAALKGTNSLREASGSTAGTLHDSAERLAGAASDAAKKAEESVKGAGNKAVDATKDVVNRASD